MNEDTFMNAIGMIDDEKEVDTFLKDQAKHIYAAQYNLENQKQIKKQFEIISKELNDKLISSNIFVLGLYFVKINSFSS